MNFPSSSTAWAKIVMTAGSAQRLGTQDYRAWDGQYVGSSAENFLTEVETNSDADWGLPGLTSLFNGFTNCTHLEKVPNTLPNTVTDLRYCFQRAKFTTEYEATPEGETQNTSRPFLNWDVSNVEKFDIMFSANSDTTAESDWLTAEDFSGWTTSNATTMRYMFQYQRSFEGNGLDQWDTSQCTNFTNMFESCSVMNVNLRGWIVDSSSSLSSMFVSCQNMFNRHGDPASSPEYTEYYGTTPDIEFFNYTPPTPTTIEMLDGTVYVLSDPTNGVFDPEQSSVQLQGYDKESILKLSLGSKVTSISDKFKGTGNPFNYGFYTIDMSNSKITTLPDYCFEGLYVQHAILNKELKEISAYCFRNCVALCVLTIPEDSDLNEIKSNAFDNASNFKGLYIPPKVCYDDESEQGISIDSSAFSNSSLDVVLLGKEGDNTSNSSSVQLLKGKADVDVTVNMTDFVPTKITTSNDTVSNCNIVGVAGSHHNVTIFIGGSSANVLAGFFKTSIVEIDFGSITSINNYTFSNISSLNVIDFRRANKLETISNNSFTNPDGSTSLETVHFHQETHNALTSLGSYTFQGNDNLKFDTLDLSVYPNLTQILGLIFIDSEITTLKLGQGISSIDDWSPICKDDTIETLDLSKATSLTYLSNVSKSDNPFGTQSNINKVILHGDVTSVNNYFGYSDNMLIEIPENNGLGITESTTTLGNYTVSVTFV